jgi:opacity protein-like surface antigen
MMKDVFRLLSLSSLLALPMYAQETPKADFFMGYSYLRTNSAQGLPAGNLNGGIGSFTYNFTNTFGVEAEFGGYHNNAEVDNTSVSYLFGPRFSYGRSVRIDPFVHVLFGGMHTSVSVDTTSTLIPPHPAHLPPATNGRYSASQANFAMVAGGGVDFHLSKGWYFRAAELDYVLTRFEAPDFLTPAGATTNRNQNNFRFSVGIGFNFGTP